MEQTIKAIQANKNKNKGFASIDKEQQKAIARKGGLTISQNREHMREIGRRGGEKSGQVRSNKVDKLNSINNLNSQTI